MHIGLTVIVNQLINLKQIFLQGILHTATMPRVGNEAVSSAVGDPF